VSEYAKVIIKHHTAYFLNTV